MMFAARGIAISCSVFLLVYCVLSLGVCLGWRRVWWHSQGYSARRIANLLFALRMSPLAAAVVVTAVFTVPSFLVFEPRAIDEPMGAMALSFGSLGAALGIFGALNMGLAVGRAGRAISAWTRAAQPVGATAVPVLRVASSIPAMVTAGIFHPRILLSGAAESVLSVQELEAALNHEAAHVRQRDNLKKLLLRLVAFPGMAGLEAAWHEASEMAADEAAASNAAEALDLAGALIKLSRMAQVASPAELTAALLHGAGPVSAVHARVERLIAWSEFHQRSRRNYSAWYGLAVAIAAIAVFSITYGQLLVRVHAATEWLVR